MRERIGRIYRELTKRQHGLAAVWQLVGSGFRRSQVDWWLRVERPPKVRWGVYGEPAEPYGAYMAAALALGAYGCSGRRTVTRAGPSTLAPSF
jgi:hypothetical protein